MLNFSVKITLNSKMFSQYTSKFILEVLNCNTEANYSSALKQFEIKLPQQTHCLPSRSLSFELSFT